MLEMKLLTKTNELELRIALSTLVNQAKKLDQFVVI